MMIQSDSVNRPSAKSTDPEKSRPKWKPLFLGLVLGLVMGLVFMGMTRLDASRGVEIQDAPKRFNALLEDRDPLARAGSVARLFSRLATQNSSAPDADSIAEIRLVFEASRQIYDGDVEFALLGAWWARFDPEAAYQWTRTNPRGASRRVLVAVVDEWGSQDPLAAVLAVRTERSEMRRQDALAAALTGADRAVLADATDLIAVLEQIPNRQDRRVALRALVARQLRSESPAELLARAAGSRRAGSKEKRSEELAEDWVAATAMVIAPEDPVRAAESLAGLVQSSGTLPPGVIAQIASGWGADAPVAALEWLSTLGPGEERADAVRATYRGWLGREMQSALDWAAQRAENPDAWFDPIRGNYAFILGQEKPKAGLRLLFMLPVGDERALYVQFVFAGWKATDPDPAEAWLQQADLPESRKEQLRRFQAPAPRFPRKSPSPSNQDGAAES